METLSECILCRSAEIATACEANRFWSCRRCGHFFDNPRPSFAEITEHYSRDEQYDPWLVDEGRMAMCQRRLRKVMAWKRSGTLLDVGAGIGDFLSVASQHFDVHGTEISMRAGAHAEERFGISLRLGTVESIRWDRHFTVITMFHVLEHVPLPAETLSVCASLLEPGGVLVIAVPNDVTEWRTRHNRLMGRLGVAKYASLGKLGLPALTPEHAEIHLSHFTPRSLRAGLLAQGLDVVEESLDPAFSALGSRRVRRYWRYGMYSAIQRATGVNLYETMWFVARKRE